MHMVIDPDHLINNSVMVAIMEESGNADSKLVLNSKGNNSIVNLIDGVRKLKRRELRRMEVRVGTLMIGGRNGMENGQMIESKSCKTASVSGARTTGAGVGVLSEEVVN